MQILIYKKKTNGKVEYFRTVIHVTDGYINDFRLFIIQTSR